MRGRSVLVVVGLLAVGLAVPTPAHATADPAIATVAGNGTVGAARDGKLATSASVYQPQGVALDADGNLFIADSSHRRIRRVDAETGIITTVAGTGDEGFTGDGGPATDAQLGVVLGLAVDGDGNLFFADVTYHVVWRVDGSTGIITVVAGTGSPGYTGDGGPADEATLTSPWDVAVDTDGNLFIADTNNNVVRIVDTGGTIDTYAGTGSPGFSGAGGLATSAELKKPEGVAVDADGNLFIADEANHRIRRVDATSKNITTVAGTTTGGYSGDGGPATSAELHYPTSVAVNGDGDLFIVDSENCAIRRVDGTTQTIVTIAGTGACGFNGDGDPSTALLNYPLGLTVVGETVFFGDSGNNRVRASGPDGDGDGIPDGADRFPSVPSVCHGLQATKLGTKNADVIDGTSGPDVIMGRGGGDTINGKGGGDLICAGDGADVVHGGGGKDVIYGEGGGDTLSGDGKRDKIHGGPGNDDLFGGKGNDVLDGGSGTNDLSGGQGSKDTCSSGTTYQGCEFVL